MDALPSKELNFGYLTKSPPRQGNKSFQLKRWQRRWFVLNCFRERDLKSDKEAVKTILEYYEDKKTWFKGEAPKGSIPMNNVVNVRVCAGLSNAFEVIVPSRDYYLKAANQQERDEWVKYLLMSLEKSKMAMWFQFYNKNKASTVDIQPIRSKAAFPFETEDVCGWPNCTVSAVEPETPPGDMAFNLGRKKRSKSLDCLISIDSTTSENGLTTGNGSSRSSYCDDEVFSEKNDPVYEAVSPNQKNSSEQQTTKSFKNGGYISLKPILTENGGRYVNIIDTSDKRQTLSERSWKDIKQDSGYFHGPKLFRHRGST